MARKTAASLLLFLAAAWSVACTGPLAYPNATPTRRAETYRPGYTPLTRPAAHHRVVKVSDGDSVTLVSDGVTHKARLSGIDAPETEQPYGSAAKSVLATLVEGRWVTFTDSGRDRYQRTLVRLYVDGIDVNLEMVRRGLAWRYRAYTNDSGLAAAEQQARMNRRGLWSQPNPVPPWEWRRVR